MVNAARKHGMESPLTRARSRYKDIDVFSHETEPKELSALDQGHTGRCWAFAGLNLMRRVLCTRLELHDDLVLSQSYFMFYDKFEKARYALRVWSMRGSVGTTHTHAASVLCSVVCDCSFQ